MLDLDSLVELAERFEVAVLRQRVGVLLEELAMSHPELERWRAQARRGGSSRLLGTTPCVPSYSERWNLSINAPLTTLHATPTLLREVKLPSRAPPGTASMTPHRAGWPSDSRATSPSPPPTPGGSYGRPPAKRWPERPRAPCPAALSPCSSPSRWPRPRPSTTADPLTQATPGATTRNQADWISPMMLPSASFTDAISLPPPTSLTACSASAPAPRSCLRLSLISTTCQ